MTKQIKISKSTFEALVQAADENDRYEYTDDSCTYVSIFDREGLEVACGTYDSYQPSTFYKNSKPALHTFGRWNRVVGDFDDDGRGEVL